MDALRRLFGDNDSVQETRRAQPRGRELSDDERAVERYRYLLRTAPPETIETAHAEAFSQLTPEQRRMVLQELTHTLTPAERTAGLGKDAEPESLARLATRAEMRQPGTLERTWSGMPAMSGAGGIGLGGLMMGNFFGTFAGVMLGSAVADAFLGNSGYDQGYADASSSGDSAESADAGAADSDIGADDAFADSGGALGGIGDFGDFGGDF